MSRLLKLALPVALVLVVLEQAAALAATTNVSIVDFAFSPATASPHLGGAVQWTNTSTQGVSHTTTSDSTNPDGSLGVALWDSNTLSPSSTFNETFTAAGSFPYHCKIHTFMTGTIDVKPRASASSGTIGSVIRITWATISASSGFVYDVQMAVPGGSFQDWQTHVTTTNAKFTATATGKYRFRARLVRTSTGGASLYSPARSVTIS